MSSVTLNRVTKVHARARARRAASPQDDRSWPGFRQLELTFPAAKFSVLLGASGSGKTTLLRLIAGLDAPDAGDILFGGEAVTALPPIQRNVAMVFQQDALYPHLTVEDNVLFPLESRHMPRAEAEKRAREVGDMLELEHLWARRPEQLSGGERQRVALARAIVRKPIVLLMDEPFSQLDAPLRGRLRDVVRQLQRELAITTIFVTHDQAEAMWLADHLVLIDQGECLQQGAPIDLYDCPASTAVGSFLGSPPMNVLPLHSLTSLEWAREAPGPRAPDGAAYVGFRPEAVRWNDTGALTWQATVVQVTCLGFDSVVEMQWAGKREGEFLSCRARHAGKPRHRAGEAVHCHVPATELHWFDEATRRITT